MVLLQLRRQEPALESGGNAAFAAAEPALPDAIGPSQVTPRVSRP